MPDNRPRRPAISLHLKTRRLLASSKWVILTSFPLFADAWQTISKPTIFVRGRALQSSEWKGDDISPNGWQSSLDGPTVDWQDTLKQKEDGSFWSSFEPSTDGENQLASTPSQYLTEDLAAEAWLDTLASISAEEVQFNMKEADRANTARQMEEWGFDKEIIAAALDLSTDTSLEQEEVQGMTVYRQESYLEDVDLATVESHSRVEIDEETGEPVRLQMVYVDEHTCIGCTNCAMIAQSTFYMNPEHGRARVFQVSCLSWFLSTTC
jgi:NAD-dependent dihydropyrimidine dehydrogenase PreA subunit